MLYSSSHDLNTRFLANAVLLFDPCTMPSLEAWIITKLNAAAKCFAQILCWFSLPIVTSLFSVNSGEGNFVLLPNRHSSFLLSSPPGKQPKRLEREREVDPPNCSDSTNIFSRWIFRYFQWYPSLGCLVDMPGAWKRQLFHHNNDANIQLMFLKLRCIYRGKHHRSVCWVQISF